MKALLQKYWLLVAELNDLILEIDGEYDHRAFEKGNPDPFNESMSEDYHKKESAIIRLVKQVARLELEIQMFNRPN